MDLKMEVYSPGLELLGLLEIQNSILWERKAFGAGSFSLTSLITEEARTLLARENILWIEGDTAGVIEYIQEESGEDGPYITVKGCDLTGLLERRILWGLYNLSGPVPALMYQLVDDCCIHPTRGDTEARIIPGLVLADLPAGGASVQLQRTGGSLLDALSALGETYQVPFGVRFVPEVPCMEFWARPGVDRSIHQNTVDPVFYSTELDDVLSSEYSYNAQDYKNVALVAGEGEGSARTTVTVIGKVEAEPEPPAPPVPPTPGTKYTISVTIDPAGSGTVTGAGSYPEGQAVTLKALPGEDYKFTAWKEKSSWTPRLPEGYTEVEYILTNSTFGIDTGVKINANTSRLVMDIEFHSGSADYFLFATYGTNVTNLGWRYFSFFVNSSTLFGYRDNSANAGTITALAAGERGIIDFNFPEQSLTVGGTKKTVNPGDYTLTNNTYLGKAGSGDNAATYKLYAAQMYSDGEKIRDFVPCIDSSGIVGLYDLENGKFYNNTWSGTLTAGPKLGGDIVVSEEAEYTFPATADRALVAAFGPLKVSRLPEGYTEVEYISNPNLGYAANIPNVKNPLYGTRFEFDVEVDPATTGRLWGKIYSYNRSGYTRNDTAALGLSANTNELGCFCSYSSSSSSFSSVKVPFTENRLHIVVDSPKKTFEVNGETATIAARTSSYWLSDPPELFAIRYFTYSTQVSGYAPLDYKFYSLKIYSSTAGTTGDLLYEYVPCIDPNGDVGVYELVNGVFTKSADAAKPFTAGPAI